MGSRPPLRRPPSRSPPPNPPAPSTSSPPPAPPASAGGKIIRLPQRPGDSAAAPSRADVTLPRPLRPSRPLKRPSSLPPPDPNPAPPAATAAANRHPISWKRRLTPAADPKKAPPPEDDKPKAAKPAGEAPKPPAAPDETKPGPDRDETKADAAEATDPPEDADAPRSEDDLAAVAFEAVMVESARYERAQTEWICEAIRGIRDDFVKVAESGDRAALSKLLRLAPERLIEPVERYLKAIGEALAEMDVTVVEIRSRWAEEGTVADDDVNLEGDEDVMEEDGAAAAAR